MKFSKSHFKQSTRLKNYEKQINSVMTSKTTLTVEELYAIGDFENRASLETLLQIAEHSNSLTKVNNTIEFLGLAASVTYTISGTGIRSVHLGGKSGSKTGGTVHGVAMSPSYSFNISVLHSGGNWTFKTTKILVNDGAKRKLSSPKVSNKSNDVIKTITA